MSNQCVYRCEWPPCASDAVIEIRIGISGAMHRLCPRHRRMWDRITLAQLAAINWQPPVHRGVSKVIPLNRDAINMLADTDLHSTEKRVNDTSLDALG